MCRYCLVIFYSLIEQILCLFGYVGYALVCDSRLALFHTQVCDTKVLEVVEACLLETVFCTIHIAAIDSEYFRSGFGSGHNRLDSSPDSSQAKHSAYTVFGEFSCCPVRNFANIGGTGTRKNQL